MLNNDNYNRFSLHNKAERRGIFGYADFGEKCALNISTWCGIPPYSGEYAALITTSTSVSLGQLQSFVGINDDL